MVLCEKEEKKKRKSLGSADNKCAPFFRLDWAGRPRLLPMREQLIGGKGGSVELFCPHVGDPPVHIIWTKEGGSQRGGMGILEYQAMPSLRDVAHDGWLCAFTIQCNRSWKFHQRQLDSSCKGNLCCTEKAGGTTRPSRRKSHLPGAGRLPLASKAGRRVGPAL